MANFQTTTNNGDAADSADPDKDGQTNVSQYAAGTDSNRGADVFRNLAFPKNSTTFTVNAAGKASCSYVLERRANIENGLWATVSSIGPLAADSPVALSDPAPPSNLAFDRLRVTTP